MQPEAVQEHWLCALDPYKTVVGEVDQNGGYVARLHDGMAAGGQIRLAVMREVPGRGRVAVRGVRYERPGTGAVNRSTAGAGRSREN
jgi:hypothetical protein